MKELFEAIRAGDSARVAGLIAADPSLAVFAAAIQGQTNEVEDRITRDRSLVSLLSSDGWTLLHLAAFFGHKETAQALLNKGALVNARSANPMQNMPIHAAAAGGHTPLVKLLIERGASVNARQQGGWVALHAAAQSGNVEMARTLIEAGADVLARAENNQSPLDLALTKGKQEMVDFLETHGARL